MATKKNTVGSDGYTRNDKGEIVQVGYVNSSHGVTRTKTTPLATGGMSPSDTRSYLKERGYSDSQINSALNRNENDGGLNSNVSGSPSGRSYLNDINRWMANNSTGSGEEESAIEGLNGNTINYGLGSLAAANAYYGVAAEAAKKQMQRSDELWNLYKTQYLPGEIAWAKESFAGIPADQQVQRASADVRQSYARASKDKEAQLQGMGINPASPRYNASLSDFAAVKAAADAGARNAARTNVRDTNYARRTNAVGIGRNTIPQSSSMAGQGVSMYGQGTSAVQSGYNTLAGLSDNQSGRAFSAEQAALQRNFLASQADLEWSRKQELADKNSESNLLQTGIQGLATVAGAYIGGAPGAAGASALTSGLLSGSSSYNPYDVRSDPNWNSTINY